MAQIAWKQFKMNCENSAAWARAMDELDAEIKASYNLQAYGWNLVEFRIEIWLGLGFATTTTRNYTIM